jgi:hypothetical protein
LLLLQAECTAREYSHSMALSRFVCDTARNTQEL